MLFARIPVTQLHHFDCVIPDITLQAGEPGRAPQIHCEGGFNLQLRLFLLFVSHVDLGGSGGGIFTRVGITQLGGAFLTPCGELLPNKSLHFDNALFCARSLCASRFRCLLLLLVLANSNFPSAVLIFFVLRLQRHLFFRRHFCVLYCVSFFSLLALACGKCYIIEQSIALRLFSMISINTAHSGSLMETAHQFRRKVLCATDQADPEPDIPPPDRRIFSVFFVFLHSTQVRSKPNSHIGPDFWKSECLAAGPADPAGLPDLVDLEDPASAGRSFTQFGWEGRQMYPRCD